MLKFTKKAMSVVAPVILSAAMVFPVSAADQKISVYLNNVPIVFDTEPSINNGTTYVPMRGIFEALGADVKWNDSEKSITVINNSDTIKLYVGKNDIVINGKKSAKSPYPVISDGRTLVPLRSISDKSNQTSKHLFGYPSCWVLMLTGIRQQDALIFQPKITLNINQSKANG